MEHTVISHVLLFIQGCVYQRPVKNEKDCFFHRVFIRKKRVCWSCVVGMRTQVHTHVLDSIRGICTAHNSGLLEQEGISGHQQLECYYASNPTEGVTRRGQRMWSHINFTNKNVTEGHVQFYSEHFLFKKTKQKWHFL